MKLINNKILFKTILLIFCVILVYAYLNFLNPNKINQFLLLVFYLVIFVTTYLFCYLVLYFLKQLQFFHLISLNENVGALFLSVLAIVLLALNSVGQFTWVNFFLLIFFGILLLTYISINRSD
jgi:hypothetical protein